MHLALRLLPLLAVDRCLPAHALAAELGVGRRQVTAALLTLGELGVPVVTERGRGYRLREAVQLLDAARVRDGLSVETSSLLCDLEVLPEVDSTNRRLMQTRLPGVHACLAERQSAGRGRRGRGWVSPFARSLYLSLRWPTQRPPVALAGLSLAAGVAVAEALHGLGATTVGLKWPNDLLAGDAKLGGLLVELAGAGGSGAAVVVGVGVNGALTAQATDIDQPWTDLERLLGSAPDRNRLAAAVLDALLAAMSSFETGGFAPFAARYAGLDRLAGRSVQVQSEPPLFGVARGVDEHGALLVDAGGRRHRVLAGDVSVRALPALTEPA